MLLRNINACFLFSFSDYSIFNFVFAKCMYVKTCQVSDFIVTWQNIHVWKKNKSGSGKFLAVSYNVVMLLYL